MLIKLCLRCLVRFWLIDAIMFSMKMSLKNGLFLGLLLGVASAFLYAPKTGKELREELKDKLNNVPYHFFNLVESIVDLAASVLDFAKESFNEQKHRLSKAVEAGVSVAKEKTTELRNLAASKTSR